jgi:hypothetical protein
VGPVCVSTLVACADVPGPEWRGEGHRVGQWSATVHGVVRHRLEAVELAFDAGSATSHRVWVMSDVVGVDGRVTGYLEVARGGELRLYRIDGTAQRFGDNRDAGFTAYDVVGVAIWRPGDGGSAGRARDLATGRYALTARITVDDASGQARLVVCDGGRARCSRRLHPIRLRPSRPRE